MVELREAMEARKEELAARYARGIPTPVTRSFGRPKVQQGRPVA
jgi:hypothetical protein